ncbi:MAG: hypothetical protein IS632_01200 [Thaumarchaeota archaeon]|nr:hypothetical protein [Nitrososphaerota archaeon]
MNEAETRKVAYGRQVLLLMDDLQKAYGEIAECRSIIREGLRNGGSGEQ